MGNTGQYLRGGKRTRRGPTYSFLVANRCEAIAVKSFFLHVPVQNVVSLDRSSSARDPAERQRSRTKNPLRSRGKSWSLLYMTSPKQCNNSEYMSIPFY